MKIQDVLVVCKWALMFFVGAVLLLVNFFGGAWLYSLFTSNGWPGLIPWFENPEYDPFGNDDYLYDGAPSPGKIRGLEGYINRVFWLYRNPVYGYKIWAGIKNKP
ncbi:MAG: hypothetical protein R3361_09245, partial [Aequorivita vladivostokensis]|nr:hypothetical protein [Aequorivita vladivostokensis]